jgi:hypothetical protein
MLTGGERDGVDGCGGSSRALTSVDANGGEISVVAPLHLLTDAARQRPAALLQDVADGPARLAVITVGRWLACESHAPSIRARSRYLNVRSGRRTRTDVSPSNYGSGVIHMATETPKFEHDR